MLKAIVCSSILMALVYGYQSFVYSVAKTSYWGAMAICGVVLTASLIASFAIDRSRRGRR